MYKQTSEAIEYCEPFPVVNMVLLLRTVAMACSCNKPLTFYKKTKQKTPGNWCVHYYANNKFRNFCKQTNLLYSKLQNERIIRYEIDHV